MYNAGFRALARKTLASSALVSGTAISIDVKPSIYPTSPPELILVETPSELEKQIGVARRATQETLSDVQAQLQGVITKWIGVEHAVEHRVKSILSPTEPLTPNALYVGIATLSGSILTRNRSILTRVAVPFAFFTLSFRELLPETYSNLTTYLGSLESHYYPELSRKHDVAIAHSKMGWEMFREKVNAGKDSVYGAVEQGVTKTEAATGLKFKEGLGYGQKVSQSVTEEVQKKVEETKAFAVKQAEKAEAKVAEAKSTIDAKVEQVTEKVEAQVEKVEEIIEKKVEEPIEKKAEEPPKRLV